jgi:hypothetical protein
MKKFEVKVYLQPDTYVVEAETKQDAIDRVERRYPDYSEVRKITAIKTNQ